MNKLILKSAVTLLVSFILGATAWNFAATASMPEKYVSKDENREDHQRIFDQLDNLKELIMKLHLQKDKK
jgi:hypothetical protein